MLSISVFFPAAVCKMRIAVCSVAIMVMSLFSGGQQTMLTLVFHLLSSNLQQAPLREKARSCRKGVRKNAVFLSYPLIFSYFLIFYFIHQGSHGSVHINGCIKSICTNGKWKPKMRTDVCCYKQQVKFYMFYNLSCI